MIWLRSKLRRKKLSKRRPPVRSRQKRKPQKRKNSDDKLTICCQYDKVTPSFGFGQLPDPGRSYCAELVTNRVGVFTALANGLPWLTTMKKSDSIQLFPSRRGPKPTKGRLRCSANAGQVQDRETDRRGRFWPGLFRNRHDRGNSSRPQNPLRRIRRRRHVGCVSSGSPARLAQLDHPNILPVKNADFIDGRFVIVTQLGLETLESRLSRRISVIKAFSFIEQMISAVACATNPIFFTVISSRENFILFENDVIRLTDFGIAKVSLN